MTVEDLSIMTQGEIPIANPEDAPQGDGWGDDRNVPFLFSFGAYGDLHVVVWAQPDHYDDAEEHALDWCGAHARGVFSEFSDDDYRHAAEDLGIAWTGTAREMFDGKTLDEEDANRVIEAVEVDHVIVGHTTYPWQTGTIGVPSWEIHVSEIHDKLVRHALTMRSYALTIAIWPED